jgi:hypothetical protein
MTTWTKFAFGTKLISCVWDILKTTLQNMTNFESSQGQTCGYIQICQGDAAFGLFHLLFECPYIFLLVRRLILFRESPANPIIQVEDMLDSRSWKTEGKTDETRRGKIGSFRKANNTSLQ